MFGTASYLDGEDQLEGLGCACNRRNHLGAFTGLGDLGKAAARAAVQKAGGKVPAHAKAASTAAAKGHFAPSARAGGKGPAIARPKPAVMTKPGSPTFKRNASSAAAAAPFKQTPAKPTIAQQARAAGNPIPTKGQRLRAAGQNMPTNGQQMRAAGYNVPTLGQKLRAQGYDVPTAGQKARAAMAPTPPPPAEAPIDEADTIDTTAQELPVEENYYYADPAGAAPAQELYADEPATIEPYEDQVSADDYYVPAGDGLYDDPDEDEEEDGEYDDLNFDDEWGNSDGDDEDSYLGNASASTAAVAAGGLGNSSSSTAAAASAGLGWLGNSSGSTAAAASAGLGDAAPCPIINGRRRCPRWDAIASEGGHGVDVFNTSAESGGGSSSNPGGLQGDRIYDADDALFGDRDDAQDGIFDSLHGLGLLGAGNIGDKISKAGSTVSDIFSRVSSIFKPNTPAAAAAPAPSGGFTNWMTVALLAGLGVGALFLFKRRGRR
jgi:hypothetical protein